MLVELHICKYFLHSDFPYKQKHELQRSLFLQVHPVTPQWSVLAVHKKAKCKNSACLFSCTS